MEHLTVKEFADLKDTIPCLIIRYIKKGVIKDAYFGVHPKSGNKIYMIPLNQDNLDFKVKKRGKTVYKIKGNNCPSWEYIHNAMGNECRFALTNKDC